MCKNKEKEQQNSSVTRIKTAQPHAITTPKAAENASLYSKFFFFLNYKSYKNFQDTKYCTFHRSVIIVSFSDLSYKIIYTCRHEVRKHAPRSQQRKYPPNWGKNKKLNCHFSLRYLQQNAPFSTQGHLVLHAERCHCQNLEKYPEKGNQNL